MSDSRITELPVLAGTDLAAIDLVAVADISASETKKLTSKELVQKGVTLIDDGVIPGAKLVADSVTALQIAPDAVGFSELADGAVDTPAISDGAVTNSKVAHGIDGAKLSNNTVTAAKIPDSSLDRGIDRSSGAIGHTNAVIAATRSGISYDEQGHITATVPLVGSDLPIATASQVGGISVPGPSLAVDAAGRLTHANTITAGTRSGITYDDRGHIIATVALVGTDLPDATAASKGAVMVPQLPLQVVSGALTHADSGVATGSYTKVTVDQTGHVTAGAILDAGDIPDIDASKLTSGTLVPDRIGDRSIAQDKLTDYAVSFIQETMPPSVNSYHNGMLWLQESTGQLRMWNGNSWFPIGFGRLSQENLRYCGVFNAATGAITGLTQFGTTEGFTIGDQVPAALDKLSGVYFVAETPGNATTAAAGVAFDAGDWILCNGATAGWVRIDTLNGAGGGGGTGAQRLNDLLDVTIDPAVAAGSLLQYTASGQWLDKPLSTLVPNATDAVKGIVELATAAETTAGADTTRAVTPAGLKVELDKLAKLASPALTGTPTAPTATAGDSTTQLATTAFVQGAQVWERTGTTLGPKTAGDLVDPAALPAATTAAQGAVQLADAAAISAGTAGRVVTADQLKATGFPDAPDGATDGTAAYVRQVVKAGAANAKSWVPLPDRVPQTSAVGAATMPSGTTAERPGAAAAGMTRWNATLGYLEVYTGTADGWKQLEPLPLPKVLPADMHITASTKLTDGTYYVNDLTVDVGVTVTSETQALVFICTGNVVINGTIDLNGRGPTGAGYLGISCPAGVTLLSDMGKDGNGLGAGATNSDAVPYTPFVSLVGSSGGSGRVMVAGGAVAHANPGGSGGGGILIRAYGSITINTSGVLTANGGNAERNAAGGSGGGYQIGGSGGGSGGTVCLRADGPIVHNGTINANGGAGGAAAASSTAGVDLGGGGGGGGGVVVTQSMKGRTGSGTISVLGGAIGVGINYTGGGVNGATGGSNGGRGGNALRFNSPTGATYTVLPGKGEDGKILANGSPL